MNSELKNILEQMDEEELEQVLDFKVTCKEEQELIDRVKSNTLSKLSGMGNKQVFISFRKTLVIAASVMIVVAAGVAFHVTGNSKNQIGTEQTTEDRSSVIMYHDTVYDVLITKEELEQYHLPLKITESMIGNYLGYVNESDELSELYQYSEIEDEQFLIMKDYNGDYVFLIRR